MSYAGLPRETIRFLAGLSAENNREWFESRRADYETAWLNAGLDLIAALSGPVSALGLTAVPKLNASLRRIYRDTRFSRDKRLYDPALHMIFSQGTAFNKEPGVHIVLRHDGFGYGAGLYGLSPEGLDRYRQAVCNPDARARLLAALDRAKAVGCTPDVADVKRLPKTYPSDPAWEHLLLRKSLIVRTQTDQPLPDWLFGPAAVQGLADLVAALAPLVHWLHQEV